MTNEDDKKEPVSDKDETASSGEEKAKKIAEKLESMGVTPSDKTSPEINASKRKYSPLLITLLIAIPAVGVIVYMNMPDTFNKLLPSTSPASSAGDHVAQVAGSNHSKMPVNPAANYWNRPQGPEWLAKQRADMEQRRLEFQRRNPEPEWVARQRAYMEKQQSEFQKQNSENIAANRWRPLPPPEWVNNKQADMERSMAQHQSNAWPQGRTPEYMRHPGMDPYQANNANVNHQVQVPQNNNPVNANTQPQAQPYTGYNYPPNAYYNNAQQNRFVPYPPPYGSYGYPYR